MQLHISGLTSQMRIDLWDFDEDDAAVWRVSVGGEDRFVEGKMDDTAWMIADKAIHAYDKEE